MTPAAGDWLTDARAHLELLMTADQAVPGWRSLEPKQRRHWFQHLYKQAAHLDHRYQLGLRSGWWTDEVSLRSDTMHQQIGHTTRHCRLVRTR